MTKSPQKRSTASVRITSEDALSVFPSELGWIGILGADDCVIALSFGHETPVGVRRDLQRRLLLPDQLAEENWSPRLRDRLQSYAAGDGMDFSDVALRFGRLSPFRLAVITAVRNIEYGGTITYGELARQAGSPGAARAVGRVMATNPIPLIVPCHRVLGAGGHLGGFSARTGVTMKQRLLDLEQDVAAQHDTDPPASRILRQDVLA